MDTSLYSLADGCFALRVRAAATDADAEQRLPTHSILLVDASESMLDGNKLENVKHSASMVLNFLGATDKMSIVTFGEDATRVIAAASCAPEAKPVLEKSIRDLTTNGCTNMSAGLLAVRRILEEQSQCDGPDATIKTGLLLLTDGHANRGDASAAGLQRILASLREAWPGLTTNVVGYGLDHNVDLLKSMAEQSQGSYSVVESREGAATVIGDMLGTLFSCVAQQMVVRVPGGLRPEGTQFTMDVNGEIKVGDVIEGGEALILLTPDAAGGGGGAITVDGYLLPSLEAYRVVRPLAEAATDLPADLVDHITLTRLRYRCAALFRELRESPEVERIEAIRAEVSAMEVTLGVERFVGNAVASMLVAECGSLRKAMDALTNPRMRNPDRLFRRMAAHEALTSLGRGMTRAIDSDDDEPENPHARFGRASTVPEPVAPGAPAPLNYVASPFRNRTARRVTNLMATMSSLAPEDVDAVRAAAAEASQYSVGGATQGAGAQGAQADASNPC
jgi:Mg-chelatase subunit ChlD